MSGEEAMRRRPFQVFATILIGLLSLVACDTGSEDETGTDDVATTLDQALADHVAGRLDDAREGYQEVLAEDPQSSFAPYNLGLIAQTEGDNVAAEDFYRRALAVDPSFEPALFNLAIVRADEGDIDEAIELNKLTIRVNPDSAGAHLNLGFLYLKLGKEKRGNTEIAIATELDPSLGTRPAVEEEEPQGSSSPSPSG